MSKAGGFVSDNSLSSVTSISVEVKYEPGLFLREVCFVSSTD